MGPFQAPPTRPQPQPVPQSKAAPPPQPSPHIFNPPTRGVRVEKGSPMETYMFGPENRRQTVESLGFSLDESLKPVPDPESWRMKVEGSRLPPCPLVCPDLDWVPLKPEVLLTSLPGPSRWAAVMGWKCRSWAVLPKSDPSSKERALLYNTLRLAESFENAENVRTGGYHAGTEATVEELIEKVTMLEPAQKEVDDTKRWSGVCKNFIAGRCAPNSTCVLSHDTSDYYCRRHLLYGNSKKYGCTWGKACRYTHNELTDAEKRVFVEMEMRFIKHLGSKRYISLDVNDPQAHWTAPYVKEIEAREDRATRTGTSSSGSEESKPKPNDLAGGQPKSANGEDEETARARPEDSLAG